MVRPTHDFPYAPGTPQLELLGAATLGDLAHLERMVRKLDGGRGRLAEAVEAVMDHGVGALHLAAGGHNLEVCEYLVEDVGVNVDAVNEAGKTPLVWAITVGGGHVDIVRYLLDHGANPDNVDMTGFTPLHEAVKGGHCEIVELLLSRGAYVDPFSVHHGTPLHVAAQHKQEWAMKILLDHHADCNKILRCFSSPLIIAIESRSVKCVKLLVKAGADVKGTRHMTPLLVAVRHGLTDALKCLLDAGADPNDPNEFGHLPIQLAAYFGRRKDVEILFEVTSSRIPAVHDWSVDGIISYVKAQPKLEDLPLSKMSVAELKKEGSKSMYKEDYSAAIEFYNMAITLDHENVDPIIFGNRGFCRIILRRDGALNDAQICRQIQPDCPHACWLEGYSYLQLQEFEKACDSFLDAVKLDPGHLGIQKALREALRLLTESDADKKKGLEAPEYRPVYLYH
ncbi:hypothetical protein ACQJBY_026072 [Aegilops geniculata]